MAISNICNYHPIQSISTKAIDIRFKRVHDALCYLSSPAGQGVSSVGLSMPAAFTVTNSPVTGAGVLTVTGAGTASQYILGDGTLATLNMTGASEGLSISSNDVVLGQAVGEVGNPAALNTDREIPMQNHIISFTDTGNEASISSFAIGVSSLNGDNLISLNTNGETSITIRDFVANEPYLMFGVTDTTHNLFMFNNDGVLNVGANLSENFFSYDSTIGTFSVINNIPDLTSSMEVFVVSSGANTDTTGGDQITVAGTFINETTVGSGANLLTNVGLQVSANQGDFNYAALFTAGSVGINLSAPTARLHIQAGSTNAGTAPIKLNPGPVMLSPENGAIEFDGTTLWITSGGTRRAINTTP